MKKIYILLFGITILASVLRLYRIESVPPGLYIDEASIGINAYSILTEGKDEHGEVFPLWFEAFGEYKMPVYIYMVSSIMMVTGKSEFAVRLPSIIFGIASVPILFFLLKELLLINQKSPLITIRTSKTSKNKKSDSFVSNKLMKIGDWGAEVALIASFLLAIAPWHIHFSRGGFEANVAMGLFLLGCLSFTKYLIKLKNIYLYSSATTLIMTMYTYNSYRIVIPLVLAVLVVYAWKAAHISIEKLLIALITGFILMIPVIQFSFSTHGNARFSQTSAFTDLPDSTIVQQAMHAPMIFLKNYMSYFSFNYLFSYGDQYARHQDQGMGLLYRWQLIFLLIGILTLFVRKKGLLAIFLLSTLCIVPIPAALTIPSPHSLRALLLVVPITVLSAIGLYVVGVFLNKKKIIFLPFLLMIIFFEFGYFLHRYFEHYPKVNVQYWGEAYKEMVEKTKEYSLTHDEIVIDKNFGDAELYYRFYDLSYPSVVSSNWTKPEKWANKRVLFIRYVYKEGINNTHLYTLRVKNQNNDVFAEFYSL